MDMGKFHSAARLIGAQASACFANRSGILGDDRPLSKHAGMQESPWTGTLTHPAAPVPNTAISHLRCQGRDFPGCGLDGSRFHVGDFHRHKSLAFAFIGCFHKGIQIDGFFRRHGWLARCERISQFQQPADGNRRSYQVRRHRWLPNAVPPYPDPPARMPRNVPIRPSDQTPVT